MKLATLASGSSGNASLVKSGNTTLLIDAGLSGKRIEERLRQLGEEAEKLSGILVTHEHSDHTNGVGVLARRHKIPVYVLEDSLPLLKVGDLPPGCCRMVDRNANLEIGDLKLELFDTSHDSAASTGFVCFAGTKKVGFATDTGEVTSSMIHKLKGSDALIFEANHDEDMLWQGSYPYYLKKRVASSTGHLSNHDSGQALAKIIEKNTKRVILAHLSEENNLPQLALNTVGQILTQAGVPEVALELRIRTAPRHSPLEVGEI